jgi:Tfp pilus assembly protein FimT
MIGEKKTNASGFAALATILFVIIAGAVAVFAAPTFKAAMREYRLNKSTRQIADLIARAESRAASENRNVSLSIDAANRRIGIAVGNARSDVTLPGDIVFARPENSPAAPGSAALMALSDFDRGRSRSVDPQGHNSRNLPTVNAGAAHEVYLTNGSAHRAITVDSSGGVRAFRWENREWLDFEHD